MIVNRFRYSWSPLNIYPAGRKQQAYELSGLLIVLLLIELVIQLIPTGDSL